MSTERFLKGTLILICAGLITRFIGFFYRIFLSQAIGAQDLGIYQLTAPLQMLSLSAAAFGIQTAVSKLCAAHMAVGKSRDARDTFLLGAGLSLFLSVFLAWILYHNAGFFAVDLKRRTHGTFYTSPFFGTAFQFPAYLRQRLLLCREQNRDPFGHTAHGAACPCRGHVSSLSDLSV